MRSRLLRTFLVLSICTIPLLYGCKGDFSARAETDTTTDVRGELYRIYSENMTTASEATKVSFQSSEPDISFETTVSEDMPSESLAVFDTDSVETTLPVKVESAEVIYVYITPTGKKYHYSTACAGKNAIKVELTEVEDQYKPCKKCAE